MTMKTKTIFLALVAMTALFCACDDEKETTDEFDLKVNQFYYDGKVFDVKTTGDWDERMGWLDVFCESAGFVTTIDHHWDLWESGKTVDLAKDGYPESFAIMGIEGQLPSSLPSIQFYGKAGEIDGVHYDNMFKSGTVKYTGGISADKLTFKFNATLANGKVMKFWFEFKYRQKMK